MLRPPLWGFAALSALGLPGLLLVVRDRRYFPMAAFCVLYTLGLSAFFVYGRYRLPLAIPLAILGAAFLSAARNFIAGRQWRLALAASVVVVVAAWFVYAPVPGTEPVSYFPDYLNQGSKYYTLGQTQAATEEYERALFVRPGTDPRVPILAAALADLCIQQGDRGRAEAILRRVIARGKGTPELERALARLVGERR